MIYSKSLIYTFIQDEKVQHLALGEWKIIIYSWITVSYEFSVLDNSTWYNSGSMTLMGNSVRVSIKIESHNVTRVKRAIQRNFALMKSNKCRKNSILAYVNVKWLIQSWRRTKMLPIQVANFFFRIDNIFGNSFGLFGSKLIRRGPWLKARFGPFGPIFQNHRR